MSDDIKHLAHSLLNRAGQHKSPAPKAPSVQNMELAQRAHSGLPKHLLDHAHAYITKIQQAKGHPL